MSRTTRLLFAAALSVLALAAAGGTAAAVPIHGQDHDPVDGPMPDHQHGGDEGHLPAGSNNMGLVRS